MANEIVDVKCNTAMANAAYLIETGNGVDQNILVASGDTVTLTFVN